MTDRTTKAPVPTHLVSVVSDGYEFLAECACGWASEWHDTPDAADEAGREHKVMAAGPADRVDVAATDLLDLADDLATVVVWLAENWSADLPAPHSLGTIQGVGYESRAAVNLLVYCPDSTTFARVARILEAPVQLDDFWTTDGFQGRRAIRQFGRVSIDAFTTFRDTR